MWSRNNYNNAPCLIFFVEFKEVRVLTLDQRQSLMRNLEHQEGRVNHMYLDSNGYVTVGVGHLVATVQAAQRLPFQTRSGRTALDDEIKDDF